MTALDGNFAGARYDPNTEEYELPHLLFTAGQMQTTRCSAGRLPSHSRDALRTRQGSKKIAESKNACTVFGNASHTRQCKMIPKKTLLFAPCAFNLAETSRMVEIAKAVQTDFSARDAFPW